jgi:hypothetical protein
MTIGRFSTQYVFSMPIGNPRWSPPQDIDYHWTLWEYVHMPSSQSAVAAILNFITEQKA